MPWRSEVYRTQFWQVNQRHHDENKRRLNHGEQPLLPYPSPPVKLYAKWATNPDDPTIHDQQRYLFNAGHIDQAGRRDFYAYPGHPHFRTKCCVAGLTCKFKDKCPYMHPDMPWMGLTHDAMQIRRMCPTCPLPLHFPCPLAGPKEANKELMAFDTGMLTDGYGPEFLTPEQRQILKDRYPIAYEETYGTGVTVTEVSTVNMAGMDDDERDPWANFRSRADRMVPNMVADPDGGRYHVAGSVNVPVTADPPASLVMQNPPTRVRSHAPMPAGAVGVRDAGYEGPAYQPLSRDNLPQRDVVVLSREVIDVDRRGPVPPAAPPMPAWANNSAVNVLDRIGTDIDVDGARAVATARHQAGRGYDGNNEVELTGITRRLITNALKDDATFDLWADMTEYDRDATNTDDNDLPNAAVRRMLTYSRTFRAEKVAPLQFNAVFEGLQLTDLVPEDLTQIYHGRHYDAQGVYHESVFLGMHKEGTNDDGSIRWVTDQADVMVTTGANKPVVLMEDNSGADASVFGQIHRGAGITGWPCGCLWRLTSHGYNIAEPLVVHVIHTAREQAQSLNDRRARGLTDVDDNEVTSTTIITTSVPVNDTTGPLPMYTGSLPKKAPPVLSQPIEWDVHRLAYQPGVASGSGGAALQLPPPATARPVTSTVTIKAAAASGALTDAYPASVVGAAPTVAAVAAIPVAAAKPGPPVTYANRLPEGVPPMPTRLVPGVPLPSPPSKAAPMPQHVAGYPAGDVPLARRPAGVNEPVLWMTGPKATRGEVPPPKRTASADFRYRSSIAGPKPPPSDYR